MQEIAAHKRDVQPSEMTLDWCVSIVNLCSTRLSTMCILANTPIRHVSVANDAYDQLQRQLGGDQQQQQPPTTNLRGSERDFLNADLYSFGGGGGGRSASRRSSSQNNPLSGGGGGGEGGSASSPSGGLAVSYKERRLILRVEAARAMLQKVATYITHRLEEEGVVGGSSGGGANPQSRSPYTRDENYGLYKAVGTMHHWLLADDALPPETAE